MLELNEEELEKLEEYHHIMGKTFEDSQKTKIDEKRFWKAYNSMELLLNRISNRKGDQ